LDFNPYFYWLPHFQDFHKGLLKWLVVACGFLEEFCVNPTKPMGTEELRLLSSKEFGKFKQFWCWEDKKLN
jgi:hypothetical protein